MTDWLIFVLYTYDGWFFSHYLFGNTCSSSPCTFRVLFHCQTSSVGCIIQPWIIIQRNKVCKSMNFIIKMSALLRKFIARFSHFMVSLIDPLSWDDIKLFFAQNARAWLAWHVVSIRCCHMPHSTRINGLIERTFYFMLGIGQLIVWFKAFN